MATKTPALLAIARRYPGNRCLALLEACTEAGGEAVHLSAKRTTSSQPIAKQDGLLLEHFASTDYPTELRRRVEAISANQEPDQLPVVICEDEFASDLCQQADIAPAVELWRPTSFAVEHASRGPTVSLLPRAYQRWYAEHLQLRPHANRILVDLGEAGEEFSTKLAQAVQQVYPAVEVQPEADPSLLTWSDVVVTSNWQRWAEFAVVGRPTIYIRLDETQDASVVDIARQLAAEHACMDATKLDLPQELPALAAMVAELLTKTDVRLALAQAATHLVDCHEARRQVAQLQSQPLWLRDWEAADIRQIWNWNNEPVAKAAAIESRSATWNSHCLWFEQAQATQRATAYLATKVTGEPLGYACFTLRPDHAEIEVVIDAAHRGQGLGSQLIAAASERIFRTSEVNVIHAYLKAGSVVSLRAFEQAGYQRQGSTTRKGCMAYHFVRSRQGEIRLPSLTASNTTNLNVSVRQG